ncbi:ornithine decarboxylase [Saccharomycopsis crataegensis]|uniref:ornithine decarboxylase n=1 Tax=Saccharomycopsis crataegensis TaxID=43959 RepID=A0AAV5QJ75_9ASCO|nr:ornithine decarboxylase [Saccharomycopsis crataegensis]
MTALFVDSSRSFNELLVDNNNNNNKPILTQSNSAEAQNPHNDLAIINKSIKAVGHAMYQTLQSPEFQDFYNDNNSFFVCDLGEVYRLYQYWKHKLPRIHPFYAIKCNTDPEIIKILGKMGANFDCASKREMEIILQSGIDPSRIVFSNPCKFNSHLKFAKEVNVNLTVFDNEDELVKIAKIHPHCKALLRIETDDKAAVVRLSTKYGAKLSAVDSLLAKAKDLGVELVGVHFHCGAGSDEFDSIIKAIKDARNIFDQATSMGFNMNVLDLGGGYMISNNFDNVCTVLNTTLDQYFPTDSGVRIISEPGRFFPTSAFTLASNIIGKRDSYHDDDNIPMVYINDGIYANMNCIINDHYTPIPKVLSQDNHFRFYDEIQNDLNGKHGEYEISCWGQTCDSADVINKTVSINYPVNVGDWFFFRNMGAYTLAATTDFNGFNQRSKIVYISSEEHVRYDKISEDWII